MPSQTIHFFLKCSPISITPSNFQFPFYFFFFHHFKLQNFLEQFIFNFNYINLHDYTKLIQKGNKIYIPSQWHYIKETTNIIMHHIKLNLSSYWNIRHTKIIWFLSYQEVLACIYKKPDLVKNMYHFL